MINETSVKRIINKIRGLALVFILSLKTIKTIGRLFMNYTTLKQRLVSNRFDYQQKIQKDGENITLTLTYNDPITNAKNSQQYKVQKSQEYLDIVKQVDDVDVFETDTRSSYFSFIGLTIKDIDENTIKVYPNIMKMGKFTYWKGYNNFYLLYDNVVISAEKHICENTVYCGGIDKFLGTMADDILIYVEGEKIVAVNKNGESAAFCYYPEPEDGKDSHRKITIRDDKVTVAVYVYYDNDWHHGGWEEEEYPLSIINKFIQEKQENKK